MKKGTKIEKELKKTKKAITYEIKRIQKIKIEKEDQKTFFEIINSNQVIHTNDVAEGVALLIMNNIHIDSSYWKINITDKDKKEIDPIKALYWLSGGNEEWLELKNYKINWPEASIIFKKKYAGKVKKIVKKSKTLNDIKIGFENEFNMTILYEFSLENSII